MARLAQNTAMSGRVSIKRSTRTQVRCRYHCLFVAVCRIRELDELRCSLSKPGQAEPRRPATKRYFAGPVLTFGPGICCSREGRATLGVAPSGRDAPPLVLFSPHWSPDGRYIAAQSSDSQKLMLFDFKTQKWAELARITTA